MLHFHILGIWKKGPNIHPRNVPWLYQASHNRSHSMSTLFIGKYRNQVRPIQDNNTSLLYFVWIVPGVHSLFPLRTWKSKACGCSQRLSQTTKEGLASDKINTVQMKSENEKKIVHDPITDSLHQASSQNQSYVWTFQLLESVCFLCCLNWFSFLLVNI